jgi:LPXTG-motif cell wall-anchored protein
MRSRRIISTLIGAGIVAASTVVAVPAVALPAWTPYTSYTVECDMIMGISTEVLIYEAQGAVLTFNPATCTSANWSALNTGLPDNTSLSGTATFTIEAEDIACDRTVFIYGDGGGPGVGTYYQALVFRGCDAAPSGGPGGQTGGSEGQSGAPEAAPLPDTGIDATALGLAAVGLLAAGVATIVVVRRRNA